MSAPNRTTSRTLAATIAVLLLAVTMLPAQNTPHIGYLYPAGGQQGTTFSVLVGGQNLRDASGGHVSGSGVSVKILEQIPPLTNKQASELRDELDELTARKRLATQPDTRPSTRPASRPSTRPTWTAADDKRIAEIRARLAGFNRRPSSPAIAETLTIQVTIAANAAPGQRELRLLAAQGPSNPLVFQVGRLAEIRERDTKDARGLPATLPCAINGQIMPGQVDRYWFAGRRDQQLVAAVSARELIPYIADAVPGWFQATLTLYDARGREVAYSDDFRLQPDPVLACKLPADGEYVLEIKDAIYRGREDFVYRITVGELPYITGVFPLGGLAGRQTAVELSGWNLPRRSLIVDATGKTAGTTPVNVGASNSVPFALDTLGEFSEQEPNDSRVASQPVTLPIIANGRIDRPGDTDVYRFDGKLGDEVVAEIHARRLGSPLDSLLQVLDAQGKVLASNDDTEDKGAGLVTHHADSRVATTLPSTGTYFVQVSDTQQKGGPDFAYRLRISQPRPDFALRSVPSSIYIRGGSTPITVHALRMDGFAGEITLALKDAPTGWKLTGAKIPANEDKVRMTLSVPPGTKNEVVSLKLEGKATVQGRAVVHAAVPADDLMQAFAYRHLVCAEETTLAIAPRAQPRTAPAILTQTPLRIVPGGTARVRVALPPMMAKMQPALSDPPEGITLSQSTTTGDGIELTLSADAARAKPGTKGNLIVELAAPRPAAAGAGAQAKGPKATLPAIPFEIVSLGK